MGGAAESSNIVGAERGQYGKIREMLWTEYGGQAWCVNIQRLYEGKLPRRYNSGGLKNNKIWGGLIGIWGKVPQSTQREGGSAPTSFITKANPKKKKGILWKRKEVPEEMNGMEGGWKLLRRQF